MFTTSAVMIRHLRAPTLHDKILDEARSISMSTATRKTDEDEDEDEDEDGDE